MCLLKTVYPFFTYPLKIIQNLDSCTQSTHTLTSEQAALTEFPFNTV